MRSRDEHHDLSGVHDGAHADGEGLLRHLLNVVVEKPRVGVDRLLQIDFMIYKYVLGIRDCNVTVKFLNVVYGLVK